MFEALERSRARGRLGRAFAATAALDPLALELKGLLIRHLCVITAGVLEECLRLHISEYARVKSLGYVAAFVTNRVSKTTNLTAERLIGLLGEFDRGLADEMAAFIDDRRKAALNSLISLRHAVAHGKDSSSSLVTVTAYKDVVLEILDKVDDVFQRISA
jgi:hypothetical protein